MSTDVQRSEIDMSGKVAEEIRALMARRRMSGRELARQLDVSPSWVSYRLTGTQAIDLNDLGLIAKVLGVTMADLLPRDERSVTVRYPDGAVTTREPVMPSRSAHARSPLATTRPPAGRPPNGSFRTRPSSARTRPTGL